MKARDSSWVHSISFNPLGRSLACFCFSHFIPIISPLRYPNRPGNTRSLFFFLPGFCTFCCGACFSLSFLTFLPLIVLLRDSPSVAQSRILFANSDTTIKRSDSASLLHLFRRPSSALVRTRRCRTSATVQIPCRPKGASETRDYPASPQNLPRKLHRALPTSSSRSSYLPSFS
ncbi:hypothetical protein BJY00DRAFT_238378 [Aspergillus carlsbadensis]|nr:hypothetical protein BJY00DRAFT_238378 [Aspergillus carlsbadensis]